jgi:hypothetical protein
MPGDIVRIIPEESAPIYKVLGRGGDGLVKVAKIGGRFGGQTFSVDGTTVCTIHTGPAPRRQGVKVEREVNKRRKAGVLR